LFTALNNFFMLQQVAAAGGRAPLLHSGKKMLVIIQHAV
jgi:hypothetical protein